MNKLSVMLLLAFAAHGALATQAADSAGAESPRADAIARLAETEMLLNRKTAELIQAFPAAPTANQGPPSSSPAL